MAWRRRLTFVDSLLNGVTTVIEAGTIGHLAPAADGRHPHRHPGRARRVGMGHRARTVRCPDRRDAGPPGRHARRPATRRSRRRMGRRSSGTTSPPTPCSPAPPTSPAPRRPHDDAHRADEQRPRGLPGAHRRAPDRPLRSPGHPRPAPAAGPRGVARRRGDRADAQHRYVGGVVPVGVPPPRPGRRRDGRATWRCTAPASPSGWAATRRTPTTASTSSTPPASLSGSPRTRRSTRRSPAPTTGWRWRRSAGPARPPWPTTSARSRSGRPPTSSCTTVARPQWRPRGNPVQQLVWTAQGRTVRDVLVDGRVVVRDGHCTTVDADELRERAAEHQAAVLARAGLSIPQRWPVVDGRVARGRPVIVTAVTPLTATFPFERDPLSYCFVRVETDTGLVGYGEACDSYGCSFAGCHRGGGRAGARPARSSVRRSTRWSGWPSGCACSPAADSAMRRSRPRHAARSRSRFGTSSARRPDDRCRRCSAGHATGSRSTRRACSWKRDPPPGTTSCCARCSIAA